MCPESNQSMKNMNTNLSKQLVLAGAAALLIHTATAQTWQTVDTFQYVAGRIAQPGAAAADSQGNIYVAGYAADAAQPYYSRHGITRRSTDQGQTWATVDDLTDPVTRNVIYTGVGVDTAQNVYVLGVDNPGASTARAMIRRSSDSGSTWSTVVNMTLSGVQTSYGSPHVAVDASGRVYAAFNCTSTGTTVFESGDGGQTWSVVNVCCNFLEPGLVSTPSGIFLSQYSATMWDQMFRSVNGGATWTVVDRYAPAGMAAYYGNAGGICTDLQGNIWLSGSALITSKSNRSGTWYWLLRKSTNGGATWKTTMLFPKSQSFSLPMACDASGYLYIGGQAPYPDGTTHGVVYRSADDGVTWNLVDDQLSGYPHAFACDPAGNVYVTGRTGLDWVVRKQ
jgi:BNR repeat-like domain